MGRFKTEVLKQHSSNKARLTRITTAHGEVLTPCFMPVATRAFVNHMTPEDLLTAESQLILGGNTYHMLIAPGMEVIEKAGGMHRFMHWDKPMLTDSGGFQVFSLSRNKKLCKIDEVGAHFKHPVSGQLLHLTPQSSIATQKSIGADIIMAFDQCTPEEGGRLAAVDALTRTHRWLLESIEAQQAQPQSRYGEDQALFGIIQGGSFRDLREQSAEFVLSQPLDGIAIGGEIIGGNIPATCEIVSWIEPLIPRDKTRYTMGVGLNPQDLFDVAAAGIDIFDCVAPTRNARHGALYCGQIEEHQGWLRFVSQEDKGRILIKKAIYALDEQPIMPGCGCYTCQHFTRSYLHFLFRENLSLYFQLACIHNVYVMNEACRRMRESLINEFSEMLK